MKACFALLSITLLLSACELPSVGSTSGAKRTPVTSAQRPASGATTGSTAKPGDAAGALQPPTTTRSKYNAKALVSSLHNALGATRASRLSSTLNEASGVIGNNGGSIVSDNGLGLISNNGGGIVSDNGLGYRVAQSAPDVEYTVETGDLIYYFFYKRPTPTSAKDGIMKIYDKGLYQSLPAAEREQALLDHFVWDDIALQIGYKGKPLEVAIAFPMRKVSSKRLPFADRMLTRRIARGTSFADTNPDTVGWEYEFDLDIALLGNATDKASFLAVAGEKDIVTVEASSGGEQSLPVRLAITGKNASGTYAGTADYDKHQATFTHTDASGAETVIAFFNAPGAKNRMEVESVDAKLKVIAELEPNQGGTGRVLSTAGAEPEEVATLTYDAEGLATITFVDGTTAEARLF